MRAPRLRGLVVAAVTYFWQQDDLRELLLRLGNDTDACRELRGLLRDPLLTDVIVSGKPRSRPDVEEVWLAVEVSSVVDRDDVSRAVRRCRLLARGGRPVVPVVAGEAIAMGADEVARGEKVAVVQDGGIAHWDEALEAALGAA